MPPGDRAAPRRASAGRGRGLSERGPRVALATAASARALDEDLPPLLAALEREGAVATAPSWDDPTVDWAGFDIVVIRSTWDYTFRRDAFVDWARAVGGVTALHNPAGLVAWNTDKRYLHDLEGVSVIDTAFFDPGETPAFPSGQPFVVKPSVSAGARNTARYEPGDHDAAARHVADLHASGRTAMVQPYAECIERDGETGLVFVDGRFSHAFSKSAILSRPMHVIEGLYAAEIVAPTTPTAAAHALAEAVLAQVPGDAPPLYARVDTVPTDEGPALLELELTEPSFFFTTAPDDRADRFAAAILARVE